MNGWLKANAVNLVFTAAGIIVAFTTLMIRVEAIEEHLVDQPALIQRFVVVEQQVKDIARRLDRIEAKIDTLLEDRR